MTANYKTKMKLKTMTTKESVPKVSGQFLFFISKKERANFKKKQ